MQNVHPPVDYPLYLANKAIETGQWLAVQHKYSQKLYARVALADAKSIEKAILSSDLGFNPTNDGNSIRINIPQLTEERRKDLIKLVAKTGEQAKVAIRNERREANEAIKKMEKTSELTEDDSKKAQDEVQKLTDSHIKMIDDMLAKKEKDIMEV